MSHDHRDGEARKSRTHRAASAGVPGTHTTRGLLIVQATQEPSPLQPQERGEEERTSPPPSLISSSSLEPPTAKGSSSVITSLVTG